MHPTTGIGWKDYSIYIYFMKIGKTELMSAVEGVLEEEDVFDAAIRLDSLRTLYSRAFSFFMPETVIGLPENNAFAVCVQDGENISAIGVITKENFDDVRNTILLANYVPSKSTDVGVEHSSDRAKELWDIAQEYLSKQSKPNTNDTMSLGNILSKLCAIHASYNYLNVFDLTVFQMYDAFFQSCYMRSVEFSESIVSNHGSKEFKYSDWMNPVKNYT